MRRRVLKNLLLSLLLAVPFSGISQLTAVRDSVRDGYDFWLYRPDRPDSLSDPLPLVLFLHGRSLCGSDLRRVLRYGCMDAVAMGREIPAVIVTPQNRGNAPWNPQRLMRVVEWVRSRCEVDTARLYLLGMSMGGYGVLDFAATYPGRTAAAVALCGGVTLGAYDGLAEVPLWIIHGSADTAVPVTESRKVAERLQRIDSCGRLIYTELKGVNHSRLARVFYHEQTYRWLFGHSLTDSLRPVDRTYAFDSRTLDTALRGLHTRNRTLDMR